LAEDGKTASVFDIDGLYDRSQVSGRTNHLWLFSKARGYTTSGTLRLSGQTICWLRAEASRPRSSRVGARLTTTHTLPGPCAPLRNAEREAGKVRLYLDLSTPLDDTPARTRASPGESSPRGHARPLAFVQATDHRSKAQKATSSPESRGRQSRHPTRHRQSGS